VPKFAPMSPSSYPASQTVGRCLAGALLLSLVTTSVDAGELLGIPRMLDGDTVLISGVKVRLKGIDAPENKQLCLDAKGQTWSCGIEARDRLIERWAGQSWACSVSGGDRYGRQLGSCRVGSADVQQWMVRSGLAVSYKRFSRKYDVDEVAARDAREGLWSGTFIAPWNWREWSKAVGAGTVAMEAQKVLRAAREDRERINWQSEAARPQCRAVEIKPTTWLRVCSNQTSTVRPELSVEAPIAPQTSSPNSSQWWTTGKPSPTPTVVPTRAPTGRCQNPDDRAANGSRCGGRAASVRKGGR
jgi:endonuclease YncB( thermonuclease family)